MINLMLRARFALLVVALASLAGAVSAQDDSNKTLQIRIPVLFARAGSIAQEVSLLPQLSPRAGVILQAQSDNSIVVSGSDEQVREARQSIHLRDVKARDILVKAEVILVRTDASGKKHRLVVNSSGFTNGSAPIHLKSHLTGGSVAGGLALKTGVSDVQVRARLNGDTTIDVDGTWEVEYVWTTPGKSSPVRYHNTYTTSRTIRDGDTAMVNGTILKSDSDGGGSEHSELLLFLTPAVAKEAQPKQANTSPAGYQKPAPLP